MSVPGTLQVASAASPAATVAPLRAARAPLDFDRRPILVFWETTKACGLACRHCRACALPDGLPGELSHEEGLAFLDSLTGFGRPSPVLVLTGGDVLLRPDLRDLVAHARSLGIPTALSPSVTPLLTAEALDGLHELGVQAVSISLDGAGAAVHDGVRQVEGHFASTVEALRLVRGRGLTLQVNTVVMRDTVEELPEIAALLAGVEARIWEVFFLVQTGRGSELAELSASENEDVCHFLYDVSRRGLVVRTVEAPFFRRVVAQRLADEPATDVRERYGLGPLYERLSGRLHELVGPATTRSRAQTKGTRDGKGIIFVAHDGEVHPAGFLPLALGNVTRGSVVDIYRDHPTLREIRAARFTGRCGACEFAELCGGSRARAYAASGDPLGEDPACAYRPITEEGASPCLTH